MLVIVTDIVDLFAKRAVLLKLSLSNKFVVPILHLSLHLKTVLFDNGESVLARIPRFGNGLSIQTGC